MYGIFGLINSLITVLDWLILIRIVISWVAPYSRNQFVGIVYDVTEPILRPFRVYIPIGNSRLDLSPILAYFALNLLRRVLFWLMF